MIRSVFFVPGEGSVRAGALLGLIPTTGIALNSDNGAEMVTSGSEREQRKFNSKIPTAIWLPTQYLKQQVLKFRLGTYVTLLKP